MSEDDSSVRGLASLPFRTLFGEVCLDALVQQVFSHLEDWERFLDAAYAPGDKPDRPANLHHLRPPLQVFSLPGVGEARLASSRNGVAFEVRPTEDTFRTFADLYHLSYEAAVFALTLILVGAGDVFRAMPEEEFATDAISPQFPFLLLNALLDRLAQSQDQMPSSDFIHLKEFFLTLLTKFTSGGSHGRG